MHPLANAVDTDIYPTPPLGMEMVNQGWVKAPFTQRGLLRGLLVLGSLPHPLRGSPLAEGAFLARSA